MLIIFDLDDTLVDTSACITPVKLKRALTRMVKAGRSFSDEEEAFAFLSELDRSALSAKEALQKFVVARNIPDRFYKEALEEIYDTLPEGIDIYPVEGALEALDFLASEAKLALVSAGKMDQQLFKMKKAGIDSSFFYKIFVSEHPDKGACYRQLIRESGLLPKEVIVCGDRIATDLLPAKNLGCVTIHVKRGRGNRISKPEEKADFVVTSLKGVIDIFRQVKSRINFLTECSTNE